MDPTPGDLSRLRELYSRGQYCQALSVAEAIGPLREWTSTSARLLAGRLAMQLGAPVLGRKIHLAAFRATPSNLEAIYYHARYRFERFGPFSCWRFMRRHQDWSDAAPELRADWLGLKAFVAALLRDADRAEKYLAQADKLAPQRAWICVERAAAYEACERYTDALAAARQSLELQTWFRPGVQAVAHLLQRLGKSDEALELLQQASSELESGLILAQLASLQLDLGLYAEARNTLDRFEKFSPLLEKSGWQWLIARRCDAAYHLGDREAAAQFAAKVNEDHYQRFAKRLATIDAIAPGIRLKHQFPCGLKLTAVELLAHFWNETVSPPSPAAMLCDLLPDPADRRQLEAAGWCCREFKFCPSVVHRCLEAGLPVLLSLVDVGICQTRLILGSDRLRETIFMLDPAENKLAEVPCRMIEQRFAASGPRCLLAVPVAAKDRLPQTLYPDEHEYDRLYALQEALQSGRHDEAQLIVSEFRNHPNKQFAKLAELAWARGTNHPVLLHDAAQRLLQDFPHDGTLVLTLAAALRELGRVEDRLQLLEDEARQPAADAIILQTLAQMLLINPREQERANHVLRRSLRFRPHAAAGYYLLASQAWEHQQFDDAVELYRLACCLDEREEQFADAYFRVARANDQMPEALRLLQLRATRAAMPPPAAVRALFQALVESDEAESAFGMLSRAISRAAAEGPQPTNRPTILTTAGELSLFKAEMLAHFGRFDDAHTELAHARPNVPELEWHRSMYRVARLVPDPVAALNHLRAALDMEPLWIEGQRNCVGLLLETKGTNDARAYVDALARRFPSHYGVQRLRVEFLTPQLDHHAAVDACKLLLELCPHDAWARRQLALVLADRGRDDEAKQAIDQAGTLEPRHPSFFAVLAHVHRRGDRIDAALDAYKAAVRANVDHELAATELVNLARGRAEKRAALRLLADELHRQPHNGDGLVCFRDQMLGLAAAHGDDDDQSEIIEELQHDLEQILEDRPDLWQAWSLEIQQLGLMNRLDEAAALARDATERFPLLVHLWADRARVAAALGQSEDRLECLRQALVAAPGWAPAAIEYAEALAQAGQHDDAVAVLRRAAVRSPTDANLQAALAEHLWSGGYSQAAVAAVQRAIRFDPGFDTAWRMLAHWSERLERPEEPIDLARELTRVRPGDARGWLRLARLLADPAHHAEAMAALDTVLRIEPTNVEAHDLRAERFAEIGQYDLALAAAVPPVLAADLPLVLQGRAAWVEAKRGNFAAAIPPMQKLVSVEPEYFWGWQQLAEWYNEIGKNENFLEASSELVRLKPEHPVPLTMRGEARLKTGDRAGGKEDLREALRLAPQYAPAAVILFDACLADREWLEARKALAMLQEHAVGVEVLTKQIQLACRLNDCEGALRALAEIAESPGDRPPIALQVALTEIAQSGWELRAAKVLHTAWQSDGSFNPWAAIYWLDTPDGESAPYEERMAALDAAIAAYPRFAAAYDRKAELLALVGRFDEALAVCTSTAFGTEIPVTLRGRAAWVEARRGRRGRAIAQMANVVRSDPDYLWGWRNLAQWYDAEGRHRECLDAADRMVQLAPADPLAYGYRGEARRTLGDHRGALEDFSKAFELDARFEAAGLQLIAEQLHAHEVEAARRTLARLEEHATGPLVLVRGVQVAAASGDLEFARRKFRLLAQEPLAAASLIAEAVAALDDSGWQAEADDELARSVLGERCSAAVAAVWATRMMQREQDLQVHDALPRILECNPAAGREAVLIYALASVRAGRADAAAAVIHRHADHLRSDDPSWAAAGSALAQGGLHALAVNWLSDWRTRAMIEPEMLLPLVDSLRALDRDHDALTVCRDALELGGEPPAEMLGWLALAAASEGRTTDAAQSLAAIDRIGLPDGTRLVVALAEALVMVQQAGPDAKAAAFTEAREHLRAAAGSCEPSEVPIGLGRWYRRVVRRLAADSGLLAAKCWAFLQRIRPAI